jgi:hypothetical protein
MLMLSIIIVFLTDYIVVYYESIKLELKIRCIYECRCDERLQTQTKEFTLLTYTGLVVEVYGGTGTPKDRDEVNEREVSFRTYMLCEFIMNESIKRELKIRCIYECRCDERLQTERIYMLCAKVSKFICALSFFFFLLSLCTCF